METEKFLRADGGVYDGSGNVITPPSELGRLQYQISAPIPSKYLKPDGSVVSEQPGGGGGGGEVGPPGPPGPQGEKGDTGINTHKLIYFGQEGESVVVTATRPSGETLLFPKTFFPVDPGVWYDMWTIPAGSDISDDEIDIIPGDHFSGTLWLLSDIERNNVLIRVQSFDATDDMPISHAAVTVNLTANGVSPIPVSFNDIYQVLRTLKHSSIYTKIGIMTHEYGCQLGLMTNPPNNVSYINTAAASENISQGAGHIGFY